MLQISLSVADLLASLCMVPFSLYSTLDRNYRMMGESPLLFPFSLLSFQVIILYFVRVPLIYKLPYFAQLSTLLPGYV